MVGKILTSQNYSVILYRAFVTTAGVLDLKMRAMKLNYHMMRYSPCTQVPRLMKSALR